MKGSGRRAPTAHGAQPAVRLCCVQARRAVGGSSTWQREQAVQSSMASTARMVPKPTSHSSITGSRSCSHSNVVGGWSLLHKLGAEMVLADDVAVRLRLLRNTLMHGACEHCEGKVVIYAFLDPEYPTGMVRLGRRSGSPGAPKVSFWSPSRPRMALRAQGSGQGPTHTPL